jgi:Na+/phosphate symporter
MTPDVNTLHELGNLQGSRTRKFLDERLKEIDQCLRRAQGDIYRVLQGQAQMLEELMGFIDDADAHIKEARAKHEPKVSMRKAF